MRRDELRRLRAVAIEPTYFDLPRGDLNVGEVVSAIADAGANCLRLGALSHNGRTYYPSAVMPHAVGLRGRDIVGEFAEACEKAGLALGIYSNSGWTEDSLVHEDDWITKPFGRPMEITGSGAIRFVKCCHHSPYYDLWLEAAREIVERYRPAFFYIDCFAVEPGCRCPYCRRQRRLDRAGPAPRSTSSRSCHAHLLWVRDAKERAARRAYDAVKRADAQCLVVWNRGGFWGRTLFSPEVTRRFATDFGDGFHTESAVRLYGHAFGHIDEQTLIAEATGAPVFTWVEYPVMPWSHLSCPPAEEEIKAAKVFANGARPMLWSLAAAPPPDARGLAGAAKVYRLAARNPETFDNTRPAADTAILFASATAQAYAPAGDEEGKPQQASSDYRLEFGGMMEALLRRHIPVRVVLEDSDLSDVQVLVLPNAACLSDRMCRKLGRFVRKGGGLIATYETSLYDETGEVREDFGLADVFGVRYVGRGPIASYEGGGGNLRRVAGYMRPANDANLFRPWPKDFLFPVAGRTLCVATRRSAETLASMLHPTRYYCDHPGPSSDQPGCVFRRLGKGVCVYLPWQAGRAVAERKLLDVERLIAEAVTRARRTPPLLETDLPSSVTLTCRWTATGDLAVHLVNLSCDPTYPVERVAPVRGGEVTVRLPGAASVRALVAGRALKTQKQGPALRISLPPLGAYEVMLVRRGKQPSSLRGSRRASSATRRMKVGEP